MEKTFWSSTQIVFLGLLIDSMLQIVAIPEEKITWAIALIQEILDKNSRKVTVKQLQKLCGFLNFLCRSVVPGHAFTRWLYAPTGGKDIRLKPHHHVRMKREMVLDLKTWLVFLRNPQCYCHPFMDFMKTFNATDIQFFTDACKVIGMGGIFKKQWIQGLWDMAFLESNNPSIAYLELFALTTGVIAWAKDFQNKRVILNCNNEDIVEMVNASTSNCKNCMVLIRLLTLQSMIHNVRSFVQHVSGISNDLSDSLSRNRLNKFHQLALKYGKTFNEVHTEIPDCMWPPSKIWFD